MQMKSHMPLSKSWLVSSCGVVDGVILSSGSSAISGSRLGCACGCGCGCGSGLVVVVAESGPNVSCQHDEVMMLA